MTTTGIIFSLISSSNIFNHAASWTATVIAMYCVSVDERATTSCLRELYPKAISPIHVTVTVWLRPFSPTRYDASTYIVTLWLDPALIVWL
jgi:hypothetical protein